MLQLNNDLVFRYNGQELELTLLADKSQSIATYDQALSSTWKSVFFTFERTSEGVVTILTHVGGQTNSSTVSFSNVINSITIGENFNGFLQDIRVYTPSLSPVNSQIILPAEASFLPQCLCPNDFSLSPDEAECTMTDQTPLAR